MASFFVGALCPHLTLQSRTVSSVLCVLQWSDQAHRRGHHVAQDSASSRLWKAVPPPCGVQSKVALTCSPVDMSWITQVNGSV